VYKDLVKFYVAAFDILTSKSFLIAVIDNQLSQRLSGIIHDFLQHAAHLRSRLANATLKLVTDINTLLQDNKSSLPRKKVFRCSANMSISPEAPRRQ
jgi:hypothetical protein